MVGSLSSHIGNLSFLHTINLQNNSFYGGVPSEVGRLFRLRIFGLSNYSFTLVKFQATCRVALTFKSSKIGYNKLSGIIPKELSSLQKLETLHLRENNLIGVNSFVGQLPANMGSMSNLQWLRLEANRLGSSACTHRAEDLKFLSSIVNSSSNLQNSNAGYNQVVPSTTLLDNISSSTQLDTLYLEGNQISGIIPTEILKLEKLIGLDLNGNFLTGEPDAVKASQLDQNLNRLLYYGLSRQRLQSLNFKFTPNGSLEKWLHPVRSDDERYITENLNLSRRLDTAIDVASALEYLHNQCEISIIHCDLKPSNILLDEDMVAHVGDFGLAKFLQGNKNNDSRTTNSTSSFSPRGTVGYIPPEDMYSYGVLLLEMFTRKRQTDEVFQDGLDLHQLCKIGLHKRVMKIIDSHMIELKLEGNEPHQDIQVIDTECRRGMCEESGKVGECISSIVKVGVGCSMSSPIERMNIKDVLKELLAAKKFYESR
ncbi:hypothetical protein Syun_030958 [Stephania yunnanensis]|uniref:non-specific serine/threonine protein kinase n=1 Tax=Stephania yunnanensis TaxID=152371 RepID=A0AAP0HEY2_9MAGN